MRFSVEELRSKTTKLQRQIGRRNLREYLAGMVVLAFCGVAVWRTPQIVPRIAYAWVIAAAIFYTWYLRRWGSAKPVPIDMGTTDCARFYRHELERQRDLLRSVWKWALAPVLPGVVLLAIYNLATSPAAERWHQIGYVFAEAAIFFMVIWLNLRAARRLSGRIAELERDLAAR